jgi:predicted TIM-barrel fold metal-dependent hydrolase
MRTNRRRFLKQAAVTSLAVGSVAVNGPSAEAGDESSRPVIIDTHQHLWSLSKLKPPWLTPAREVLYHNFRTREYLEATRGLNVRAIYMEVDLDPAQHIAEAEHVVQLCRSDDHPTVAAVVGGRPASPGFDRYVEWLATKPEVKGIRQVLHRADTKPGCCLQAPFIRGVRLLGKNGLSFDLCVRPAELRDGIELARRCPDTRLIVDHCGNADPTAFQATADKKEPTHDLEQWRRDMEGLAKRRNVICKISGIVARAPEQWTAAHLAPIVDHCLDVFGPDRVVFGSDWPVCLLGAALREWIDALTQILSKRPAEQRMKLWRTNAERFYGLDC